MTKNKTNSKDSAQSQGGIVTLFPTTCYIMQHSGKKIDKMNKELARLALEEEKQLKAMGKTSIKGGHHSDRQFLERDNWAVKELKELYTKNTLQYLKGFWKNESTIPLDKIENFSINMGGWTVILREGDLSTPHIHARSNLSGVYYVSVADINKEESFSGAGDLILHDPRIRAGLAPIRGQSINANIPPKVGNLVMFPSYLEHSVMPFKGEGVRISIAFNVAFSPSATSAQAY